MSIQNTQRRGINLTIGDVYEGTSEEIEALISPEVVAIFKPDCVLLKEVDANAGTWIRADEAVNLNDKR